MTSNCSLGALTLRTPNTAAGSAFYAALLDLTEVHGQLRKDEQLVASVALLPEQARQRGAPAHWLMSIAVPDLERKMRKSVDGGAQRLGPTIQDHDKAQLAALRDPSGAVFSLCSRDMAPRHPATAHSVLLTPMFERAAHFYSEQFGWTVNLSPDALADFGRHGHFGFNNGGDQLALIVENLHNPKIHPQWLACFSVDDIDEALAKVRALGGLAADAVTVLPNRDRIVACDDDQGAAFGLYQRCVS